MNKSHQIAIQNLLEDSVLLNEPMYKHTTFGIGGPVKCLAYPKNIDELITILQYAQTHKIEVFVIGSGSNVLVSDTGIDGIVICLQKTFKSLEISAENKIKVDAGVILGKMVNNAVKKGIGGLESLHGVPGTVGGALIMNAGAFGSEISNYFESASMISFKGTLKEYTNNDIKFAYRFSTFPPDEILLNATFQCMSSDIESINEKLKESKQIRKKNQPLKFRSAGSIFKNPSDKMSAGYLIDQTGLKKTKSGDAEISNKHANFIVNKKQATSNNIVSLIRLARNEVAKKFNIKLELEIKLLGFNDSTVKGLLNG